MKKERDLIHDPVGKTFYHYLLPSISASLVTSVYIIADTMMIGRGVGANGIAALNVVIPLFNLFFGIGLLFGVGGAVLMAVAFGEGHIKKGQRYFTLSAFCVGIFALAFWVIFALWFNPIMRLCGATDLLLPLIRQYGIPFVTFLPVFMTSTFLQAFVRNDKDPVLAMVAVISGGVTNVVLDYVFIFIFHMGMKGGSVATVIGSSTTVCILLLHFFSKSNHLKLVKGSLKLRPAGKIFISGLASFVVEVSNGVVICLFNIQLVRYVGETGITVYGIVSNSAIVAMSLVSGVAQAAQPIIAMNYGAGQKKRIFQVSRLAVIVAVAIGAVLMAAGEVFPVQVSWAFVKLTAKMEVMAVPAVRIYFLSFMITAVNVFLTNYFQATLSAHLSLVISLLRGVVFAAIFVFVFPVWFGVNGIWMVMPVSELLTMVMGILMLYYKREPSTK